MNKALLIFAISLFFGNISFGQNTFPATGRVAVLDFFSTFDNYAPDQSPRRTASIKEKFTGGAWGGETLSFHVVTNSTNDLAQEPIERMRIDGTGNVGIGTMAPKEKLSVNGKIRAQEIKVETANWPDYVFENSIISLHSKKRSVPGINADRQLVFIFVCKQCS